MPSESLGPTPNPSTPEPPEELNRLEIESYQQFTRWLDAQLAILEERWAHAAAPAASRVGRGSFRADRHRS